MKPVFTLVVVCLLAIIYDARSQDDKPLLLVIDLKNDMTGEAIDANLSFTGEGLVRKEKGKYEVKIDPGSEETLAVSRPGYFDSEVKLDYETEKAAGVHEIRLQPGIPQLHVTILDDKTEETLTSSIDLFTMDESEVIFSEEVEVAPYTIDLEYNKAHVLQVRAPGYFSFKDTIDFTNVYDGRVREKTIRLVALEAGNKISLNNIYFRANEADLTDFAKIMLVELTHVLEQQKGLVIEIGAYTDNVGSDAYNIQLSEKRAMAVKRYLQEKGAGEQQLHIKGYGEASPVAPNDTDENRALNRRVEFKILSIK